MTVHPAFRVGVFAALIIGIFYLFPSGNPQPADLIFTLLVGMLLMAGGVRIPRDEAPFLLFVFYSAIVNAVWAIILNDIVLILPTVYYLYNFLIFVLIFVFLKAAPVNTKIVLWAALLALGVEVVVLILSPASYFRATGTFNNPNQLSYFALSFTAIAIICARRTGAGVIFENLALVLGWIIILLGLSKAAIAAMMFMTGISILRLDRPIVTIFGIGALAATIAIFFQDQLWNAVARMDAIGSDADDNLAGRGYDRIWNEVEYIFLGAGEGLFERHDSVWPGEIHSTFGTILFSYGIIGLSLLGYQYIKIYRGNLAEAFQFMTPMFIYSLTHNGVRFTAFWILAAVIFTPPLRYQEVDRRRLIGDRSRRFSTFPITPR